MCIDTSLFIIDLIETVFVSVILDLEYSQYLKEEDSVIAQLEVLLRTLSLGIMDYEAVEFGHQQ